jgi:uncharacterized protein
MNLRKLNGVLHRDLGYLFFGMAVIYGISGIALNHKSDWNPNYILTVKNISTLAPVSKQEINGEWIRLLLTKNGLDNHIKKYYFQKDNLLKVFLASGFLTLDIATGQGSIETIRKRPLIKEFNFLHYNNIKHLWTWFADLFALVLIILAISGLFIIKGKNGITGRGAWLTTIGIIIPIIFLLPYL